VAVGNRVNGGNPNRIEITTSTTQLTIKGTDLPFATGDVIHILARGY
jgi:hypothetical protein